MAGNAVCCADFCSLIRTRLNEVTPYSARLTYRKDEVIYQLDDPADALFWVAAGRVKTMRVSAEGREKIVGLHSPGDVFGELCVCEVARRREGAVALEATEVLAIRVSGLLELVARTPALSQALLRVVCRRLMDYQDQVASLSFDTVSRRLAKELVRLGEAAAGAAPVSDAQPVTGWTHEDLAALVGSTREVVTLLMNQFRDSGMIDYRRQSIVVLPRRLQEFLAREI